MNKLMTISVFALMIFVSALAMPSVVGAQYYTGFCAYHSYQICLGSNLYWYDSCGVQQDLAQYCPNGCYNNSCQNYNNYNSSCTYHAYKLCSGNNIYWYDSCGTQQDLYSGCYGGQTCQYGQCVYAPAISAPIYSNYVAHYRTACYGGSLYWYDSLGVASGLYKKDACAAPTPTPAPAPAQNPIPTPIITVNPVSVSFFAKQDAGSTQWQKTTQVGANSQVYFMISLTNSSSAQIDNVNVSANIPSEISSLGNLQINGVPIAGDIVTGINVGSIAPLTTKLVNFEGKTQAITSAASEQATATSNVSGANGTPSGSDSTSISFVPGQAAASVSAAPATTGFLGFLKRWYVWILAGLVLIILFIFIFRRLSSDV